MATGPQDDDTRPRVETWDPARIEARLREIAALRQARSPLGESELRHLTRVVTECSLLLTDVYSSDRLDRILHPERGLLTRLVGSLIEERRQGGGEVLYRVRRLPDDVRVVADKALFDVGFRGLAQVKGYDLEELGPRAYRVAAEVLEMLAEDRRLREFFRTNRLLMLPLEHEVDFLRQCSDRFPAYAALLRALQEPEPPTAAETLAPRIAAADEAVDYAGAALGTDDTGTLMSRDELLSAYERMVLFASLDLASLRDGLERVVVDQPEAIRALTDEFGLFAAGTRDLRKPPAYFLVGPTGVGKNHLVECLRRLLEGVWGIDVPFLTIEGPNYTYPSDINELRGATRGFIRSDEQGLLAAFHERSSKAPFSVILVDEVEKAHAHLRTFFLSILDRGTTTDNRGNLLNFANSMIFFTSNLGYSEVQQGSAPIGYSDESARQTQLDREARAHLRRALSPEFMNRIRLIHFRSLSRVSAERILDLELERIAARYRMVHGVALRLAPSARAEFLERGFSAQYGARHMAAMLESVCNVEVAKRIREDDAGSDSGRRETIDWLRRVRQGEAPFDPEEIRRRVIESTRARLDYDAIEVVFEDGEFAFRPVRAGGPR